MPAEIPFTEEIQQRIFELLASKTMTQICEMDGMPSRGTIHNWYARYPDFLTGCRRARDLCADSVFDQHSEVIDGVLDGTIEPDVAKAALNALQWRTIQLDRVRYGDKPNTLSITNNTDNRRVDVNFESLKLAGKDVLDAAKRQITQALEISSDNDEK